MSNISADELNKAYNTLGIKANPFLNKASSKPASVATEITKAENDAASLDITKGEATFGNTMFKGDAKKKAFYDKCQLEKAQKENELNQINEKIARLEKGEDVEEVSAEQNSRDKEVEKEKNKKPSETNIPLIKGLEDKLNKTLERLELSQQQNTELINKIEKGHKQYKRIEERLAKIEEEPMSRKSFTTQHFIEKAHNGNGEGNKGQTVLSLSQNPKEILNVLESKAELEKGNQCNMLYADALVSYESSKILPETILKDLAKQNIIITR